MNHTINTFSNSVNSTARLFFLKELFQQDSQSKNASPKLIITDKDEDLYIMRNFANMIMGEEIKHIESFSDLWTLAPEPGKVYSLSHILLEHTGSVEYIKRQTAYEIRR